MIAQKAKPSHQLASTFYSSSPSKEGLKDLDDQGQAIQKYFSGVGKNEVMNA